MSRTFFKHCTTSFEVDMVRTYVQKRKPSYSKEELEEAVTAVAMNGLSVSQAARMFNMPTRTLHDNVTEKHVGQIGRRTVLTFEEEKYIAHAFMYCGENGWPCDSRDLVCLVEEFCTKRGIQTPWTNTLGIEFIRGFEKRHSDILSKRKPQLLTVARATSMNADVLSSFFDKVSQLFKAKL